MNSFNNTATGAAIFPSAASGAILLLLLLPGDVNAEHIFRLSGLHFFTSCHPTFDHITFIIQDRPS